MEKLSNEKRNRMIHDLFHKSITLENNPDEFWKVVKLVIRQKKAADLIIDKIITPKNEKYDRILKIAIKQEPYDILTAKEEIITRKKNKKLYWEAIDNIINTGEETLFSILQRSYLKKEDGSIYQEAINKIITEYGASILLCSRIITPEDNELFLNFVKRIIEEESIQNNYDLLIEKVITYRKNKKLFQKILNKIFNGKDIGIIEAVITDVLMPDIDYSNSKLYYKFITKTIKFLNPEVIDHILKNIKELDVPEYEECIKKLKEKSDIESPIKSWGSVHSSVVDNVEKVLFIFFKKYFKRNKKITFRTNGELSNFMTGDYYKTSIIRIGKLKLAIKIDELEKFISDYEEGWLKSDFGNGALSIEFKQYEDDILKDLVNVLVKSSDALIYPPTDRTPYIFVHGSRDHYSESKAPDYLSVVPINRWRKWATNSYIVTGPPASIRIGKNFEIPVILTEDAYTHRVKHFSNPKKIAYSLPLKKTRYIMNKNVLIKEDNIKGQVKKFLLGGIYECVIYKPKFLFKLDSEDMYNFLKAIGSNINYQKLFLMLISDTKRTLEQKRKLFYKAIDYMKKTKRMEESINFQLNKMFNLED